MAVRSAPTGLPVLLLIGLTVSAVSLRASPAEERIEVPVEIALARGTGWPHQARIEARAVDCGGRKPLPPAVSSRWVAGEAPEVAFQVDPPLAPDQGRWKLLLQPTTDLGREVEGRADATGYWNVTDLAPGTYQLSVYAGVSIWHRQEVEILRSGELVPVQMDRTAIQGQITLGGDPIRARLAFLRDQARVEMYSDFEGRFLGALPEPGQWRLLALFRRGGSWQALDPVTVERSTAGDAEWLEIELPDTGLVGRVTDAGGHPREGVNLRFLPKGPDASASDKERRDQADEGTEGDTEIDADPRRGASKARSDSEGRFEFRGLPPGKYRLDGLDVDRATASAEVELREGEETEVELVLGSSVEVAGRVVSRGVPVPGAAVIFYPQFETWRPMPLERRLTGADGEFRISIPGDATGLSAAVLPPGHAARLLWLPVEPARPVEIDVQDVGGTLVLDLPPTGKGGRDWTLRHGGAFMWLESFEPWLGFHDRTAAGGGSSPDGARWSLPAMEAGPWELCRAWTNLCVGGELTLGGTLHLEAPADVAEVGSPK